MPPNRTLRPGVYNQEYFSGSQVGIYIGDVWVDEITSFAFEVTQNKRPLYGYADQHFRDVSKGRILVQGQFSINFKEAGYLFLVLDRYREKMKNLKALTEDIDGVRVTGQRARTLAKVGFQNQQNIERIINGETSAFNNNAIFAGLGGFASNARAAGKFSVGSRKNPTTGKRERIPSAESIFESFEDKIWDHQDSDLELNRRADDNNLNPFDIYIGYGDFHNDTQNHTIQKITDIHISSTSKAFQADGRPLQEVYSFIGRNVV